jgi:hypothetical protein
MFNPESVFCFQSINPSTQLVWHDETNKRFEFSVYHSCLTDGWVIERKNRDQFIIDASDSPKVIFCSNMIISDKGTTNKRRQFVIELNDYYSSKIVTGVETPIEDEHGILFSESWSSKDWDLFYSFLFDCVVLYFNKGLITYTVKNASKNYLIQKTNSDFVKWVESQSFQFNERYKTDNYYRDYVNTYYGEFSSFGQRTFTNWMDLYATTINSTRDSISSNGITYFILKPKVVK